ncbi:MAG: translation initiation factor IF-2 [Patescibacteria group bacterium]
MSSNENEQQNINLVTRPPIVVVLGHIDHGKTTLLDYIRKTKVAASESGGITQHIGAYQIETESKKITFIDTPGHEAFSKMRSRGVRVADVAILVVAADDGVKPQTKESIVSIKEAKIPFVVAINKIDKESADLERVKNELAAEEVFLEGRGGNVPVVEISAKSGQRVDNLLETILLLADLEDLKSNIQKQAEGVVIESHLDSKRGITATLLITDGILQKNQFVVAGSAMAKVRIFEDFKGSSIEIAKPSDAVLVVGFDKIPQIGLGFKTFLLQSEALESVLVESKKEEKKKLFVYSTEEKLPEVAIIVKSDRAGSAEAILGEVEKLKRDYYSLKILRADAGDVSDDDVKLARSSKNPLIVAFRVKISASAKELAEKSGIGIWSFEIIYDVYEFIKNKIGDILPLEVLKTVLGKVKILKEFPSVGKSQVIGGKIIEGFLEKGFRFLVLRRSNQIGEGKIENLQVGKVDVEKTERDREFGAKVLSSIDIVPGDELEAFKEETIKRKL